MKDEKSRFESEMTTVANARHRPVATQKAVSIMRDVREL